MASRSDVGSQRPRYDAHRNVARNVSCTLHASYDVGLCVQGLPELQSESFATRLARKATIEVISQQFDVL